MEMGFDKEKFDAVWRRVTLCKTVDKPRPVTDAEADVLRSLIDAMARDTCHCRALAARYPRRIGATLCRMVRDNCRISKQLCAMYFIVTGGTYRPDVTCEPPSKVSDGLRAVYSGTVGVAASLTGAAETTARPDFNGTYSEAAELKYHHAALVGRMIEDFVR